MQKNYIYMALSHENVDWGGRFCVLEIVQVMMDICLVSDTLLQRSKRHLHELQ